MRILRSILGVITGAIVAMVLMMAVETTNFLVNKPAEAPGLDDLSGLFQWQTEFAKEPERVCAWVNALPIEAFVATEIGWAVAAFVGGWASARIAGWAPLLHAGLIGALVLAATVMNFMTMKEMGLTHPDWTIVLGLLLPLPFSLLAGKLVSTGVASPGGSNS